MLISAQISDTSVKRLETKITKSNWFANTNTVHKSDKINESVELYLFIFVIGHFSTNKVIKMNELDPVYIKQKCKQLLMLFDERSEKLDSRNV